MLMTEGEAAFVWCPASRAAALHTAGGQIVPMPGASGGFNRFHGHPSPVDPVPPGCQCLGSRCALWTWRDEELKEVGFCGFMSVPGALR